jgi:hypothetical protein
LFGSNSSGSGEKCLGFGEEKPSEKSLSFDARSSPAFFGAGFSAFSGKSSESEDFDPNKPKGLSPGSEDFDPNKPKGLSPEPEGFGPNKPKGLSPEPVGFGPNKLEGGCSDKGGNDPNKIGLSPETEAVPPKPEDFWSCEAEPNKPPETALGAGEVARTESNPERD